MVTDAESEVLPGKARAWVAAWPDEQTVMPVRVGDGSFGQIPWVQVALLELQGKARNWVGWWSGYLGHASGFPLPVGQEQPQMVGFVDPFLQFSPKT